MNKRHTCRQGKGDFELLDVRSDLSETERYFDSLDADKDNCLSFEEFAEALRQRMNLLVSLFVPCVDSHRTAPSGSLA